MGYGEYEDAVRFGHERHERFLREAETARLLAGPSLRGRAAAALRAWADRLEPAAPSSGRPSTPAGVVHSK